MDGFIIMRAVFEDLDAILAVQRQAYQEQARLNNDYSIPPLTETLEDMEKAFGKVVMLKAVLHDSLIIGSIRGLPDGDTCHVGRVLVAPEYQGQGIGTLLLKAIEEACPKPRYELFTSNKSVDNIRLYERAGYVRFKESDMLEAGYRLVYMEKLMPSNR